MSIACTPATATAPTAHGRFAGVSPQAAGQLAQLRQPVGVFDAGIGSYAVVDLIRQRMPWQDVVYLADRASFPYGAKSLPALARCVAAAMDQLARWGAQALVLASNAPSVTVLDGLRARSPVPVWGVHPPVGDALAASRTKTVVVLGVQSLVQSAQIAAYIEQETQGQTAAVHTANASPLVDLVESGAFLSDSAGTQAAVTAFMQALLQRYPALDVCTLSSTHLPWLRRFFGCAVERLGRQVRFLDPAEAVVRGLGERLPPPAGGRSGQTGQTDQNAEIDQTGRVVCIATESPAHTLADFQRMLDRLGIGLQAHRADAPLPQPAWA